MWHSKTPPLHLRRVMLTLYQPMTAFAVMVSHKPIRIYMGGFSTRRYILVHGFCFFKLFLMVGKELKCRFCKYVGNNNFVNVRQKVGLKVLNGESIL